MCAHLGRRQSQGCPPELVKGQSWGLAGMRLQKQVFCPVVGLVQGETWGREGAEVCEEKPTCSWESQVRDSEREASFPRDCGVSAWPSWGRQWLQGDLGWYPWLALMGWGVVLVGLEACAQTTE